MLSKHAQASRKGKAVEQLIAAISVLATGGQLNALTALVDDEGVDLSFKRRNGTRTLEHAHLKPHRRAERAERLCNYFAACLLMPRPWIKHDYCGGMQRVITLARRYYVSEEAMTTRLSELGLTPMTLAIEATSSRHRGAYA